MTLEEQIHEFIINKTKKINEIIKKDKQKDDESKEYAEDFMKDTFITDVEDFESKNEGIKKIKFMKNSILKEIIQFEEISLEDIVLNIQKLNIIEFLNSYNLENLYRDYAISAVKFFQDKQITNHIVDLIKENLIELGFDNDKKKFEEKFGKKDFLNTYFPFASPFFERLYSKDDSVWNELNGGDKNNILIPRRGINISEHSSNEHYMLLNEKEVIDRMTVSENHTIEACSKFYHGYRKAMRNRRDKFYNFLISSLFSEENNNEIKSQSEKVGGKQKSRHKLKENKRLKKTNDPIPENNSNLNSSNNENQKVKETRVNLSPSPSSIIPQSDYDVLNPDPSEVKKAFDIPVGKSSLVKRNELNINLTIESKNLKLKLLYISLKDLVFHPNIKAPHHILFVVGDHNLNHYLMNVIGVGHEKFRNVLSLTILGKEVSSLGPYEKYCLSLLNVHGSNFKLAKVIEQKYGDSTTIHKVINIIYSYKLYKIIDTISKLYYIQF